MDNNAYTRNPAAELDADTVDAIGLDSTGIDGSDRFPYTYANLTDAEKAIAHAYWAITEESS